MSAKMVNGEVVRKKIYDKIWRLNENTLPLHSLYDFGALDEWLSQRSAKPSTAVRIRQAPQRNANRK